MIYLILAIVFSTGVFVAMRLFERFKLDNHQALMWNYVAASCTGFLMCNGMDTFSELVVEPWFGLSFLTGFWFILTYLLMTVSTQRSGVTVTSMSSKLSVVLPILVGIIFLNEKLNFEASVGIVLALVALVLVVGGRNPQQNRVSTKGNGWIITLLPILIFFGTGLGDILMKITEQKHTGDDMSFMIAFIYFVSLIFGIIIVAVEVISGRKKWQRKSMGGIILGVINYFSTYCVYNAMRCFDNVVFFPIYNIGVVCLTAFVGWLFFKEKLTVKNYIGLIIAVIAVILITFRP